jgi:hypothetical protein
MAQRRRVIIFNRCIDFTQHAGDLNLAQLRFRRAQNFLMRGLDEIFSVDQ